MNDRVLLALMQLFAIVAKIDDVEGTEDSANFESTKGKQIITNFLSSELSEKLLDHYLKIFEENIVSLRRQKPRKDGYRKRDSVHSVKVLRICNEINRELTQRQKFIVISRIIELMMIDNHISKSEFDFIRTVSDSFLIRRRDLGLIEYLLLSESAEELNEKQILDIPLDGANEDSNHKIRFVFISRAGVILFNYLGDETIALNGQTIISSRVYVFNNASTIHTPKKHHIYQSDILSRFIHTKNVDPFNFSVKNLSYTFPNSNKGLKELNFHITSGNLVGIMGGSGTGKSTLIQLLNGNLKPGTGEVLINGNDVFRDAPEIEGLIGNVTQDDLLNEDLTVFENLYFSARLSFGQLNRREVTKKVVDLLKILGLYHIRRLKVGNVMEKVISGGERKRLNIAMELIREPEILFIDEPTSGLSSRDSLAIMTVLKDLTFKGKLIIVSLHQPSSEIFKMLNRLLFIDKEGYPIYDGKPEDSLYHFKLYSHYANADQRECPQCGNIDPDEIFDLVEAKTIDENGIVTDRRKTPPKVWYNRYLKDKPEFEVAKKERLLQSKTAIPGFVKQLRLFFLRDGLSKLRNNQYIFLAIATTPLLALFLSFFIRYSEKSEDYSLYNNENLPQFLLMSVVVSLFLGMSLAGEEINKDKKILKREQFLNLSKGAYLLSKTTILTIISAIQGLLFVLISNSILEIKGLFFEYWFIYFTTSVWANLIGLNISSAFNLSKVIYITIPIFLIPQLLFSGAIVKFDKLNPIISSNISVPWIGNIMTSRWSFEALAVCQSKDNGFIGNQFDKRSKLSNATWKFDYWLPELKNNLHALKPELLKNEISKEEKLWSNLGCDDCFQGDSVNFTFIENYLAKVQQEYSKLIDNYKEDLRTHEIVLNRTESTEEKSNSNAQILAIVTNRYSADKLLYNADSTEIIRNSELVFNTTENYSLFNAPMFIPQKSLNNFTLSTFWMNMMVIWFFTLILYLALYLDLLKKIFDLFRRKEVSTKKSESF